MALSMGEHTYCQKIYQQLKKVPSPMIVELEKTMDLKTINGKAYILPMNLQIAQKCCTSNSNRSQEVEFPKHLKVVSIAPTFIAMAAL